MENFEEFWEKKEEKPLNITVDGITFPIWIERNLKVYGDCLIPNGIINAFGIEKVEKALKKLVKKPVLVNVHRGYSKKDTNYIAVALGEKNGKKHSKRFK